MPNFNKALRSQIVALATMSPKELQDFIAYCRQRESHAPNARLKKAWQNRSRKAEKYLAS